MDRRAPLSGHESRERHRYAVRRTTFLTVDVCLGEQTMPDRAVRRTQEERRAETERRVLAAAMALIAAHGSRSVTLAEVGEAAGYSRGIVRHHFGSRERLLAAVMQDAPRFAAPAYEGDGLEQGCGIV